MDSVAIYTLAQALHHGGVDTASQVVSALCAACSWAANNMGWPLLFSGSLVAGVGAAARAAIDGGPSGGSGVLDYRGNHNGDLSPGSYLPQQQNRVVADPTTTPVSKLVDGVYQALINHLQGK
jgi:hypothetical protein